MKLAADYRDPTRAARFTLLDEPTTGLHFSDIVKLLDVVQRLVDLGNSVLLIEHNLDVIKAADWVIDIGLKLVLRAGVIVFSGTPEDLVEHAKRARSNDAEEGGETDESTKPRRKPRTKKPAKDAPPLLRSYTGEALIPMLENATYEDRSVFDAGELNSKQEDDLDLDQIGRDTLLPWQADGKRWHTRDSMDRKGEPIRWERELLIKITDAIEAHGGFSPINWENRSIVEVSGPIKSKGWFMSCHHR